MSDIQNSAEPSTGLAAAPAVDRRRWVARTAFAIACLQTLITALWGRQFAHRMEWLGGAILEFGFTAYFALCLLHLQKRPLVAIPLVTLGLLFLPAAGMVKYQYLMDPGGLADFFEVGGLVRHYGIYGWLTAAAFLVIVGALIALFIWNMRRVPYTGAVLWLPAIAFWCVVIAKLSLPVPIASSLPSAPPLGLGFVSLPSPVLFGNWGGFLRSALTYADRLSIVAELRHDYEPDFGFIDDSVTGAERRNVYLFVLESFIDPTSIAGTSYSEDPFAPLFQQWRHDSGLKALSPVFGNRSADAEFEALCGLPVTFVGTPVVFPQLQAGDLDCLPRKLAKLGWRTETRTIADPHIYNYGTTYPKIGFQHLYFADSVVTDDVDGLSVPSAEAVLSQHRQHTDELLRDGQPFFSAVFGTFGHIPYTLDTAKRPYSIRANSDSFDLTAYINTVHYTSLAVADYVDHIRKVDPDALIIAYGDHHPILRATEAPVDYPGDRMRRQDVPLLIIDGPRGFVPLHGRVPLYALPGIVSDILTKGGYCRANHCLQDQATLLRPLPDALLMLDRASDRMVDCYQDQANPLCSGAELQAKRFQAALATMLDDQ